MINFHGNQGVVVGKRNRRRCGHAWDGGNLWEQIRINQEVLTFPKPLYCPKEEKLVLYDASAKRATKFLSAVIRLRTRLLVFKVILGAQRLIAKVEKSRALEIVASRLGDHVDYTANRAAALCRPTMHQHLKLLNRFVSEVL